MSKRKTADLPPKKPFSWKRLKNQFLNLVGNPFNMVVFFSLVILIALIVVPLLVMVSNTLIVQKTELQKLNMQALNIVNPIEFKKIDPADYPIKEGSLTLWYWQQVLAGQLSKEILWEPLLHSVTIGFFVTIISIPLGAVMAWLMVRTDLPGKKLLGLLIIIPYMIPSWCKALSWLTIFRNKTSGSLGLLTGMGLEIPDWIAYGPFAIVCVMCLHYYAFAYMMVSGSLRSINSELEEMGEIQGASKGKILKDITLPLVLPAILSAAIMTISKSMGSYGVAARLGAQVNYYVLATRMKFYINGTPQGWGYVMSIIMIGLAAGTIFANQKLVGVRKSYATIGGKGNRTTPMRLGYARYPLLIFLFIFLLVAMVLPTFFLVMESFQLHVGKGYALSNLTLYHWIGTLENAPDPSYGYNGIFQNPEFLHALWNTVKLSLIASIITAFCGQFLGYISTRGRGKWYGKLVEQLVFIPYLMPGVVFAAIYYALAAALIPALLGSFTLIVIVSVVKHFPFASRSGTANMIQISTELEEAADIAGASFWRRLRSIIIPLAKNGFISGFMLVFISIAKELDLLAILMVPKNMTLSFLAFEYSENMPQAGDAISIVILLFILLCYVIAHAFGADIGKSWG